METVSLSSFCGFNGRFESEIDRKIAINSDEIN